MSQEAITIAVSLTVKIEVPTHKPWPTLTLTPDEIIMLATQNANHLVTEALEATYPERRPGWYEWASHSCGRPVSRCISVEGATALTDVEALEQILAGADPDYIDPPL